jgi:hypothetical protein
VKKNESCLSHSEASRSVTVTTSSRLFETSQIIYSSTFFTAGKTTTTPGKTSLGRTCSAPAKDNQIKRQTKLVTTKKDKLAKTTFARTPFLTVGQCSILLNLLPTHSQSGTDLLVQKVVATRYLGSVQNSSSCRQITDSDTMAKTTTIQPNHGL